jgi:hypothetical protein
MAKDFHQPYAAKIISWLCGLGWVFWAASAYGDAPCDPSLAEACPKILSQVSVVLGNLMLLGFLAISLVLGWSLRARENKRPSKLRNGIIY